MSTLDILSTIGLAILAGFIAIVFFRLTATKRELRDTGLQWGIFILSTVLFPITYVIFLFCITQKAIKKYIGFDFYEIPTYCNNLINKLVECVKD